jgi:hypothetical protein
MNTYTPALCIQYAVDRVLFLPGRYLYGIDGVHQHCVSALALYKEAAEQALASDTNLLVVHTDITLRARRLSNADRYILRVLTQCAC